MQPYKSNAKLSSRAFSYHDPKLVPAIRPRDEQSYRRDRPYDLTVDFLMSENRAFQGTSTSSRGIPPSVLAVFVECSKA